MTKLTAKKKSKQTLAIVVMAVALVALLVFGGTYAWFTASTTAKTGSVTTGYVHLTSDGMTITTTGKVFPGTEIIGAGSKVTVDTDDPTGNYLAIQIKLSATGITLTDYVTLTLDTTWTKATDDVWVYVGSSGTTPEAKTNGDVVVSTNGIKFNANADYAEGGSKPAVMGATITISVQAKSIQSSNLKQTEGVVGTTPTAAEIAALLFPAE